MVPRARLVVMTLSAVLVPGAVGAYAADVDAAALARRLGFSAGERHVVARAPDGGSLSARACGACHAEVYADWVTTRHRAAWDNAVFQDGLAREPLPRCVHCHAPLAQQASEIGALRGRTGRYEMRPERPVEAGLAHEGVTCAVCHVRDGVVLTTRSVRPDAYTPMHDIRVEPALKDPAFCAACHQFGFTDSAVLMQGTYDEWRAYRASGGEGTCQSCHMPGGRHLFRGAHDVELLRSSLTVRPDRTRDGFFLILESKGVGHHAPTGDLFRHYTVEAKVGDDFQDVARVGRTWGGEGLDKHVVEDTSLRPGVPLSVPLPPTTTSWRVRYHYAEARHERAGVADPVVVAEGG